MSIWDYNGADEKLNSVKYAVKKFYTRQDGDLHIPIMSATAPTDALGRAFLSSTFGEAIVGSRKNNINISFSKNNGNIGNEEYMKSTRAFSSGTGVQSNANEVGYVSAGTGIGYFEIRSKTTNRYVTGHGNDVFHTMTFPDGHELGLDLWIGYGSLTMQNLFGFGYSKDSTEFGIWLRLRGVSTFIPQSEWNMDKLDEYDASKEVIAGNSFGWLGVADIDFVVQLKNNEFVHVHKHRTNNIDGKPHSSEPSMPISIGARRITGSGLSKRIGSSSWFAGTVGDTASGTGLDKFPFIKRSGVVIPANTETVLLSIRCKTEFAGKENTSRLRYGTLTIVSDGTKSVEFNVYLNGVMYNPTLHQWGDYDTNLSISEMNLNAPLSLTTRTIVTGLNKINQQIGGTYLGKVDRDRINLFSKDVLIAANPGDIITFTALSTNSSTIDFMLRDIEEQ